MTREEKIKEIAAITEQQNILHKKFDRIKKLPDSKRSNVVMSRTIKLLDIFSQIRMLEMQKHIIVSQPIPKYPRCSSAFVHEPILPEIVGDKYISIISENRLHKFKTSLQGNAALNNMKNYNHGGGDEKPSTETTTTTTTTEKPKE